MAKKEFKGGFATVLGEGSKKKDEKKSAGGRPRLNRPAPAITSEAGTKPGETRWTTIITLEKLEQLKALANWDRIPIKELMDGVVEQYLGKRSSDLKEAMKIFKSKRAPRNRDVSV
jgi:hypothetical protein